MTVDPAEYRLEFFREEGFERRRCRLCGSYFWSIAPRDTCNDAPCTRYRFWEVRRSKPPMDVRGARRLFIGFFARNGHKPIPPRPVVARWRRDLYLTIASIIVFQPHVTSGRVPPPANPLVIVQPSIRLEDIDNVGVTLGRHLTSFEMGGHHAFNYPDKHVYWKEETVRYAYTFFTKELGIPPEEIVFKESWWEGGGNAGPCFEVTVGGLELATLVFMKYRVVNGGYEEQPIKIVDTGYGIERITWMLSRKPTALHAIYGPLLHKFHELLGVEEPPDDILWVAARDAGNIDPDDPATVKRYIEAMARETGRRLDEVEALMKRVWDVYRALDYSRTLALMLGDGIVPSNTGEGYLARLVARRLLRILDRLKAPASITDLLQLQIDYWAEDYPQLRRNRSYILDAAETEEERYRKTIRRAARLIERIIKRKKTITLDDLLQLYDSHGAPPDLVAEVAARHGVKVEIPPNFYAELAKRHQAPTRLAKPPEEKKPAEVVSLAEEVRQPTRPLYHENPYLREAEAKPLAWRGNLLVLDKTIFYPLGGGQLHDTGVIEACGEEYRVKAVYKHEDVVVHVLDKEFKPCSTARLRIDWQRRYTLMRHHTAVHILLAAARRVLGSHVWQAGAEKTTEKARLDITHHKPLTGRVVEEIEREANRIIDERIPVQTRLMDRNAAEEKYGFTLYQGGPPPLSRWIRIVEIPGVDTEACYGTHVANTGEVGAIKIINTERIQDGVVRLEITAATRTAETARRLEKLLEEAASKINTSPQELPTRIEKIAKQLEELKKKASTLADMLAEKIIEEMESKPKTLCGAKLYTYTLPIGDKSLAHLVSLKLSEKPGDKTAIILSPIGENKYYLEAHSTILDLAKAAKKLRGKGVRAGGKPDHITGVAEGEPEEIVEKLTEELQRQCAEN